MNKDKIVKWLDVADKEAEFSHCSRAKYSAIILIDGIIVSTGYNGSARGCLNCGVDIPCLKDLYNEEHYISYSHCPATPLHAEMNAMINGGRERVKGGTLILGCALGKSRMPCQQCRRVMINVSLQDCYWREDGKVCYSTLVDWMELEDVWMMKELEEAKKLG